MDEVYLMKLVVERELKRFLNAELNRRPGPC